MEQFKLKRAIAFIAIIIFAFLLFSKVDAQEYLIIGNESSGTTSYQYPMNRYYDHSSVAMLYLQSQLEIAKSITHIAFQKASGNNTNSIVGVEIYMKHTEDSELSASTASPYEYDLSSYTLVWSGDFPNNSTSGWMEVELIEPWELDAFDNLKVLVLKDYQPWLTDGTYPYWRQTNYTENRTVFDYRDGQGVGVPTALRYQTTSLPNTRFQIVPAEPDLAVSSIIPPSGAYKEGTYPVSVVIQNTGKVKITDYKFHWRLNGVHQGTSSHFMTLSAGDTYTINLGDINFSYPPQGPWNPFIIEAWISNVNGRADNEPDDNPNNDYKSINTAPILNDAGVTAFIHPAGEFGSGPQNVIVEITNFAPKPLTSVTVRWEVDGVQQANYLWSGNLPFGQSTQVTIGTYDIYVKSPLAPFYFKARTVNPNGVADQDASNDAIEYNAAPALVPGVYTVGNAQATFLNLSSMADYLNASGVIGNGDVTIRILPGTYNEQISLDDFPRGINNFYFTSSTGNVNDVTLQYAPDSENNYIWQFNGIENLHFTNLRFVPLNTNGSSNGLKINDGTNVNITNCIFQAPMNPIIGEGNFMGHASIDLHNTHDVTINNNIFNGNATQILNFHDDREMHNPRVSIQNNKFNDFSYSAVHYTVFGDVMSQYDVNISNNELRAGASYNPRLGIVSINGSKIYNNTFNGLRNITEGSGSAIYVSGENSSGHSTIYSNTINNVYNISGIQVANGSADIYNNSMTLDRDIAGPQFSGVTVAYSSMPSSVQNNSLTVRGGSGVELVFSDAEVYKNAVHSTGNAILFSVNSSGYIANNQFTGTDNNFGLQIMNSTGMHIFYNSVFTNANSAGLMLAGNGDYYAKRNIIMNGSSAFALMASGVNTGGFVSDDNIYYTTGPNLGVWDSYLINDMELWRTLSIADENSQNLNPYFLSSSVLRLTQYNPAFAMEGPIDLNLTDTQRANFENYDYFGKVRGEQNTYYAGIDQIKPLIIIENQPKGLTVCEGAKNNFIEITANVSLGAKPSYQWYLDGGIVEGATEPVLDLDKFSSNSGIEFGQNGLYQVLVTAEGGATPVWSNEAAVYVVGETEVVRHPKDAYANVGETAVFDVVAHAKFLPLDEELDYQWYLYEIDRDRLIPLQNDARYAGVHTDILSVKVITEDHFTTDVSYYFVEVRGECGVARSGSASLMRAEAHGLRINEQPLSLEGCVEHEISFEVDAQPLGLSKTLSYQWYKDGIMLNDDGRIVGSKTALLVITELNTADEGNYFVEITENEGGKKLKSDDAYLLVDIQPAIVRGLSDLAVPKGDDVTLSVDATGSNLNYDWYYYDGITKWLVKSSMENFYLISRFDESNIGEYSVLVRNVCAELESIAYLDIEEGGVSVSEVIFVNSIVPNPATTEIKLTYETLEIGNTVIKLRDLTGREFITLNVNTTEGVNNIKLDVNELANGTYFIELRIGSNSKVVPVVIMK